MADISAKKAEMRSHLLLTLAVSAIVLVFIQNVFGVFTFFDRLSLSALDRLSTARGAFSAPKASLDVVIVAITTGRHGAWVDPTGLSPATILEHYRTCGGFPDLLDTLEAEIGRAHV